jgi:hypothetical protein
MGHNLGQPFWPDRHAVATRYHAGQINAQLRIHKALVLLAEIISAVMMSARRDAERSEIRAFCNPLWTPKIAGRRNRNMHGLERDSDGYLHRQ